MLQVDVAKAKIRTALKQYENYAADISAGFYQGPKYENGQSVVDVATDNEYGTMRDGKQHSPPRGFMRQTFDVHHRDWIDLCKDGVANKTDPETLCSLMGEVMAGNIKQAISAFDSPMNAESTIRQKGFNKPLVDDGFMLRNVRNIYELKHK